MLVLLAATLLRVAFEPMLGTQAPFTIHLAAAAVAAWLGGVAAGVVLLIPAAFIIDWFFLPYDGPLPGQHTAGVLLFLGVGAAIIWQVSRWRRDVKAEREAREEVRGVNVELERRVGEVEALLATTPVGLAIARDAECRTMRGNEALRKMLGVVPETNVSVTAPVRPPWRICRDGRELTGDELPMQRSAARGVDVSAEECDLVFDDGRQSRLLVSATPLFDEKGQPDGCIGVLVDITSQKRLEEELRAALDATSRQEAIARDEIARRKEVEEDLRAANRAKDDFLATLSHELRTPLNAILGWSQMLASGRLDERMRQQALESVSRNAVALSRLIGDVLEVSRMIAGKIRLEPRHLDLVALVRHAIASAAPGALARQVELRLSSCPPECPMEADPDRLQQVLWNLISNAIKFTPAGGAVVVSVARSDDVVKVAVEDNGTGIDPRFLPHVFARFSQADASATRRHGGLGLGLSIVRHLVELHGGTVHAASEGAGKGATFTVTLPLRVAAPAIATNRPAAAPALNSDALFAAARGRLSGLRVFVVDDNADARHLICAVLEQEGMRPAAFESADLALKAILDRLPDAIVADIAMPDTDGLAFMRGLRSSPVPEVARIPAVALTAYASETDRAKALEAGFQEHLAKPVLPDSLVGALAAALESARPGNVNAA